MGGLGRYSTTTVDTHTIWHIGAGVQLNQRFGFELDFWPGTSGESAYANDDDVYYVSFSTTIRTPHTIFLGPHVHFVLKGGVSQWRSTNHEEVGLPKIKRGAVFLGGGLVFNAESKTSFEFSSTQVLDKFEKSATLKANLRVRF
ncbi:MAG: hypothetical protein OXH31_05985 [Gammaproteobacteria bacterium]|nr:hypothetical protein [Gammaproteobacteria bacterium]